MRTFVRAPRTTERYEVATFTLAQFAVFTAFMDAMGEDGFTVRPPRFAVIPSEHANAMRERMGEDVYDEQFGNGLILYMARNAEDDEIDCANECPLDHVLYDAVRADGMLVGMDVTMSGTPFERLFGPPIIWEDAKDVDPSLWPDGLSV